MDLVADVVSICLALVLLPGSDVVEVETNPTSSSSEAATAAAGPANLLQAEERSSKSAVDADHGDEDDDALPVPLPKCDPDPLDAPLWYACVWDISRRTTSPTSTSLERGLVVGLPPN